MTQKNSIFHKPDCPFGKKAIALLNENRIPFEAHVFASKEDEEAFKAKHGVKTTPQIFFGDERIGGYTDLAKKLGVEPVTEKPKTSYQPIIAIFSIALLLALATSRGLMGFMGYSLVLLALQKLLDIPAFLATFQKYDLVAKAFPPYGKAYPFVEVVIGLGFIAGFAPKLIGLASVLIGAAGGYGIYKAVYVEKRDPTCGCVGGNSKVPLGPVSFIENAGMALMGLLMLMGF